MKYCILAILLVFYCGAAFPQKYTTCYVYQYRGNDTVDKDLVMKRKYNRRGLVKVEYRDGYKEHLTSTEEHFTQNNNWTRDSLLKKSKVFSKDGNKTTCDYTYNSKKQKVRMGIFFRQKMTIVHYTKAVSKVRAKYRSSCLYKYDSRGNVTKVWLTKSMPIMENSYKRLWRYDDSERVKYEVEFKNTGDTLSVDTFLYHGLTTTILQKFYPFEQERTDTTIFKTDSADRLIEKIVTSESPYYRYRMVFTYNSRGYLRKEEVYDLNGNAKLTHLYQYE